MEREEQGRASEHIGVIRVKLIREKQSEGRKEKQEYYIGLGQIRENIS